MTSYCSGERPAVAGLVSAIVSTGTRVSSKNGTLSASPTSLCGLRRVCSATARTLAGDVGLSPVNACPRESCWAFSSVASRSLLPPKICRSNQATRRLRSSMVCAWLCTIESNCSALRAWPSASGGRSFGAALDIPTSYRSLGVGAGLLIRCQPIALAPLPRLDPFQHQLQCRPVHLPRTHLLPVRDEATGLKSLRPHTKT